MKRITTVSDEILKLKKEAETLNESLEERQNRIILKLKDIFNDEILGMIN
jgi:hypothetical protein